METPSSTRKEVQWSSQRLALSSRQKTTLAAKSSSISLLTIWWKDLSKRPSQRKIRRNMTVQIRVYEFHCLLEVYEKIETRKESLLKYMISSGILKSSKMHRRMLDSGNPWLSLHLAISIKSLAKSSICGVQYQKWNIKETQFNIRESKPRKGQRFKKSKWLKKRKERLNKRRWKRKEGRRLSEKRNRSGSYIAWWILDWIRTLGSKDISATSSRTPLKMIAREMKLTGGHIWQRTFRWNSNLMSLRNMMASTPQMLKVS